MPKCIDASEQYRNKKREKLQIKDKKLRIPLISSVTNERTGKNDKNNVNEYI